MSGSRYTAWAWSQEHNQFYCASYDAYNRFLQYHWSSAAGGPPGAAAPPEEEPRTVPQTTFPPSTGYPSASSPTGAYIPHPTSGSLSWDVQATVGGDKPRRLIRTAQDGRNDESLDPRYARVIADHIPYFFVRGRVFKMLWIEPAGQTNPGQTRGSTHFSVVTWGETAYAEIRRFIVVNPKGTFSQCIPIQTYRKQGTLKPGLLVDDHGVVYTGDERTPPPSLLYGEGITKQPIRVEPKGNEWLHRESRINFGKPYAVEHNVKVMEIGMVTSEHMHLLESYFEAALRTR